LCDILLIPFAVSLRLYQYPDYVVSNAKKIAEFEGIWEKAVA
jgi:hypothetical protein